MYIFEFLLFEIWRIIPTTSKTIRDYEENNDYSGMIAVHFSGKRKKKNICIIQGLIIMYTYLQYILSKHYDRCARKYWKGNKIYTWYIYVYIHTMDVYV